MPCVFSGLGRCARCSEMNTDWLTLDIWYRRR
jgi:hypothetical protein